MHPVAAQPRIGRINEHGEIASVRQSPKRATAVEGLDKLVAFPSLLTRANLTIEVLLLREDHIGTARWVTSRQRTRDPGERRVVGVLNRVELRNPNDVLQLLPTLPPEPLSTRDLASLLGCKIAPLVAPIGR